MSENPNKIKHLEFLQLTITRMAANSFLLKAWGVTLVAALFALAAKDSEPRYVFAAYLPIVAFWTLDAFYLHQERLFRTLYDQVRVLPEASIDYSMKTDGLAKTPSPWISAFFSKTLLVFHGSLFIVVLAVIIVIN